MKLRETIVHGRVHSEHMVQLFDTSESRADAVAVFVGEGLLRGESLLVVTVPAHWEIAAARLRAVGVPLDAARESGQLLLLDADETLKACLRDGRPDYTRFNDAVGGLVREAAALGRGVRVYGEMVDLLAASGNCRSAERLEDLWSDLAGRESFTLLCGYESVHFGDPRDADALRAICGAHSHVRSNPRDVLGAFLLNTYVRAARRADEDLSRRTAN